MKLGLQNDVSRNTSASRGSRMPAQVNWLLCEGLLPLAGAGVIYLLWGCFRYAAAINKTQFTYHWREAADPLGWLYGAIIIAAQSALKCFSAQGDQIVAWSCVGGGITCLLLLVAAMTDRGATSSWKPPLSLQAFAVLLVAAVLYAGMKVHTPPVGIKP
jgi:hypothetical protein